MPTPAKTPRQNSKRKRVTFPSASSDVWSDSINVSSPATVSSEASSFSNAAVTSKVTPKESDTFKPVSHASISPRSILTGSPLHIQQSRISATPPAEPVLKPATKVTRVRIPNSTIVATPPPIVLNKPHKWKYLTTRKVTTTTGTESSLSAFDILECYSTIRDANRSLRILAPREEGVISHAFWDEEIGPHGELRLTNNKGPTCLIYEVKRIPVKPKGYGKPLRRASKIKTEMAEWKGWVFNRDPSVIIGEGEMAFWEDWVFEIPDDDESDVRARKVWRGEDGDGGVEEMDWWGGWVMERDGIGGGGFRPVFRHVI
ncbi:hypothetical protein FKW77_003416 [Venturia effusa]|uniref:Uncharacterized protein n=1 Tax=Venturia effusa TaxID=50376 RepID=A0A517L8X9_9PEZI|nr:hypothetical protein FKW77_003416 [Venturia effusa]